MARWPYSEPQWRVVRAEVLARDGGRCRIQGKRCEGDANEVDHIVPADAGGAPFDPVNLRAACGSCNKGRAARTKHREGWRRSSTEIVLVVGPPAAGKSTLAAESAGARDVVIDYDALAEALGSRVSHGHDSKIAAAARNAVLREVQRGEVDAPRVWIVSANPNAETLFPHHRVELVDPGVDEVMRRCEQAGRPGEWPGLVREWYSKRPSSTPTGAYPGPSREW